MTLADVFTIARATIAVFICALFHTNQYCAQSVETVTLNLFEPVCNVILKSTNISQPFGQYFGSLFKALKLVVLIVSHSGLTL